MSSRDGAGNWSSATNLTASASPVATNARIAVSPSGRSYAVWHQDGTQWFSRYD
jgi:hypothetical protein